jgi:hypothetical protein
MSAAHHISTLWTDDTYDRANASDQQSRYGAYLRDRAHKFAEVGDNPGEFAQLAFTIACSPIMSPGYVRTHRRVQRIDWRWDQEQRPALELGLVAPLPTPVLDVIGGSGTWRGWTTHGLGEAWYWAEPEDNDQRSAFTTLTLRCPIDVAELPLPSFHIGGNPAVHTAKSAVRAICGQVNTHTDAVLAALDTGSQR